MSDEEAKPEEEEVQDGKEEEEASGKVVDDFEAWLGALPEDQKAIAKPLFDAKVAKLLTSVREARKERDTFQKQLRDAAKKLGKGSEAQEQLTTLADEVQQANARADFYEEAPGYGCSNAKAAYLIATADDLFRKSGEPDWTAIKAAAPELFVKPTGKKRAGNGTGDEIKGQEGINQWIRRQAGR